VNRFIQLTSIITSLCFCLSLSSASAQDFLGSIKAGNANAEQWAQAMSGLADPVERPKIQEAISSNKSFPKKELVLLLSHPKLSVRLGAIELLEDASGGDNGFNAWLTIEAVENQAPLKMWVGWAAGDAEVRDQRSGKLSPEKILGYIQQLLSDDRARISRAMRMLEGDNFNVVASIQQFIVDNPTLPATKISQLKQAQYELVLLKTTRTNASHLARDLVKGNRDQQLTALANLKKLGMITIPIIRDYVDAPGSLVRETAIDAILTVGGRQTLPFISDQLSKEKDINVIHVAIRNLKDIGGDKALEIIQKYLKHEDEDLIIAAIAAITKLSGGSNDNFGRYSGRSNIPKKEANANSLEIVKLLSDNRWRVRVAALEHVEGLKVQEAASEVMRLLKNDKDEFVRHHAVEAAVAMKLKDSEGILAELFLTNDDMVGSLSKAMISLKGSLPDNLLKHLRTRNPDVIISSLKSFSSDKMIHLSVLSSFALSENIDVSCAALRLLANSDRRTKHDPVANVLTDALKSKNTEKIIAILGTLDLPETSKTDPSLRFIKGASNYIVRSKNTKLDPLYNAFLAPDGKPLVADAVAAIGANATATGGVKAMLETLVELAKSEKDSDQSFKIALILTKSGDVRGLELLKYSIDKMPVSKRAALAQSLYNPKQAAAVPIIMALLQDPSKEIRSKAVRAAFSNEKNKVLIQSALNAITEKGTKITGADAYNYSTEQGANDSSTRSIFYRWCIEQLNKEELDDRARILSLILIRKIATGADEELVANFTEHKNPWIRRAAWHALGIMNNSWYQENLPKLLDDKHPNVRAAVTDAHTRADSGWRHIFSDIESRSEGSYYSGKERRRLSDNIEAVLKTIASTDTSESNRFEAMFTLLSHSVVIDLKQFTDLISKQSKEADAVARLSDYVESNYRKMGKGTRPLLAYVDFKQISRRHHDGIIKHFGAGEDSGSGGGFATFAGLAKTSDASAEPQHLSTPEDEEAAAASRESLVIIFFEKAGCKKCVEVESYLHDMKQDFPLLEIKREYVDQTEGILLNNHLSKKLQVPSNQIRKAPAVFSSNGYLVGGNINPQDLAKLFSETMGTAEQKDWYSFKNEAEIQVAKQEVDKAFRDLTLPIVIAGGLLDGINPCAFATIIFFLSYLTIAKRSAKEIFFVGFSFILAVFLSYLSFGLLFSKALEWLTANNSYQWIRNALNYVFAGFAILVAVLSLRDWWRARQGRLKDMTLQLPNFLKKKIRSVIRENSKSSLYVFAAFGSGVAISVLELACTGQVYAPIIYKINEGSQDALTMLVIYNLAFVLPLIIIFGLAMGGMKSNTLMNFQKNHTSTIKLLTAILFFVLAAVLLFSTQISAWAEGFYPSL
jgi:cytochrome c biogenesis protein CcdA/HEAT repeat protein